VEVVSSADEVVVVSPLQEVKTPRDNIKQTKSDIIFFILTAPFKKMWYEKIIAYRIFDVNENLHPTSVLVT
jgi:hypothetical protein